MWWRRQHRPSVDPGDDFFGYANGAWLKAHPIPPTDSEYGIGRLVQRGSGCQAAQHSEQRRPPRNAAPGSDERKIGDFWRPHWTRDSPTGSGSARSRPDLAAIDAIEDVNGVLDVAFALQRQGLGPLFSFGIGQDEKASDVMAVHLGQGGLGLPDRDYYFNPRPRSRKPGRPTSPTWPTC